MARPKRVFSERESKIIGLYALNGGKNQTIANVMGMPVNTLKNRFSGLLQKMRAKRKLKLAHTQTRQAQNNSQMAIFLGKNELGQTDKQTIATEQTSKVITETEHKALKELAERYKLRLTGAGSVPEPSQEPRTQAGV